MPRLHDDDTPADEPGEWATAGEGPTGALADVLGTWTVVRRWRGVRAERASEAIAATRPEVVVGENGYEAVMEHNDVHASHGELYMLFHSKAELRFLAEELGAMFDSVRNLASALPSNDAAEVRARLMMLNSLRTQFAEALNDMETFGG